jgi:hypothetical protein
MLYNQAWSCCRRDGQAPAINYWMIRKPIGRENPQQNRIQYSWPMLGAIVKCEAVCGQ